MKKAEKLILIRLCNLLDVPLPHSGMGTKTASILGAIQYSKDMRDLLPHVRSGFRQLWQGEDWPGSLEEVVSEAESLFNKRKDENWKTEGVGYNE